ncbi:MAG TPA: hypothetical protein PKC37_09745 [Kaistella sp.]|nr:hypothetical protein [Kaistella sp.]
MIKISILESCKTFSYANLSLPLIELSNMKYLDAKLKKNQKPVLLWVYNGDEM